MIFAALGTCAVIVLIGVVCLICASEKDGLPRPRHDERNWSINYMTDFKRWTR
jgi:hypothetical protein